MISSVARPQNAYPPWASVPGTAPEGETWAQHQQNEKISSQGEGANPLKPQSQ